MVELTVYVPFEINSNQFSIIMTMENEPFGTLFQTILERWSHQFNQTLSVKYIYMFDTNMDNVDRKRCTCDQTRNMRLYQCTNNALLLQVPKADGAKGQPLSKRFSIRLTMLQFNFQLRVLVVFIFNITFVAKCWDLVLHHCEFLFEGGSKR